MKIIYIAGSGHCGSTLLDLIIGSSPEVFSTGELSFYNIYRDESEFNKKNPNYLCTCGNNFSKCPFWEKINKQKKLHIKKHYNAIENIILFSKILLPFTKKSKKYIDESYELFKAIESEAKKEKEALKYILDSSKDPRRLFYLMNDPRIEVFPILLTRNSKAVARSYSRMGNRLLYALIRQERFSRSSSRKWQHNIQIPMFMGMTWMINLLCKKLIRKNGQGMIIKYEDLCRDPKHYLQIINEKCGINIPATDHLTKVNSQTFHNIEGNNLRFKKIEEIKEQ